MSYAVGLPRFSRIPRPTPRWCFIRCTCVVMSVFHSHFARMTVASIGAGVGAIGRPVSKGVLHDREREDGVEQYTHSLRGACAPPSKGDHRSILACERRGLWRGPRMAEAGRLNGEP